MAPLKLLALARQGDLDSITRLINRSLQAQEITAKLRRHEGCLKVLLEGNQVPPQSLVNSLQTVLEKLGIQDIDRLEIHGKQRDANTLTWTKTVLLASRTVASTVASTDLPTAASASPASAGLPAVNVSASGRPPGNPSGSHSGSHSGSPSIQTASFPASSAPGSLTEPIATKACPRSYLGLAVLTTVLAFPPLGIAALLFAGRVKPQYQKRDAEGAKSASETAKILCIVGICIASPFYLAIGFLATGYSLLTAAYEKQIDALYEAQAKTTIEGINRSQQAYWLENNKFADSANQLQFSLQPVGRYQYRFVAAEPERSIITATAMKPGLKSFVGVVYAIPAQPIFQTGEFVKTTSIQSAVCPTDFPIPIGQIRREGDRIICPP